MFALSIQRRIDNFGFPIRPAPNDREIFFVETMFLHEQSESARSGRGFRDQNKTARFAIQPIHNGDLSAICDLERKQFAQFFPKCRALVGFGWMGQKKRGLIDHDVIVGFIDNSEARRSSLARNKSVPFQNVSFGVTSHSCFGLWQSRRDSWLRFALPVANETSRDGSDGNFGFRRP